MNSIFYTLGQGQAARQIDANSAEGHAEYVLRNDEVFAVFTVGDDRIEVLQECPAGDEIKTLAKAKFNFSPKRVTNKHVRDFQLGYSSVLIAHIAETAAAQAAAAQDAEDADEDIIDEDDIIIEDED